MRADIVILSNSIFDAVSDQPFEGGIAIADSRIIFIGSKEEALTYCDEGTEKLEYGNNLVIPGLCDSHFHFAGSTEFMSEYMCKDLINGTSEEDCVRILVEYAKKYPDLPRYCGAGWFPSYWGEKAQFPTKLSLDQYFPDKPVYLQAVDGHSLWVNSKALEESGYTKEYEPEFGTVDKLPNGELSGLLREGGSHLARVHMRVGDEKLMKKMNIDLMKGLNKVGVTSISDVSSYLPENIDNAYRILNEIDKEGKSTVRVYMYLGTDVQASRITELNPYRKKYTSENLHIAGVKGLIDGVTSTYTAAMLEPYSDAPKEKGYFNKPVEQFLEWVIEANKNGYSVRIHSIGDASTRACLDCYEASNKVNDNADIRNGIEHIEVIHPDDIKRFAQLGVIASMQPAHLPLEAGEKIYRCGERSRYEWAFNSIMKTGAHVAFGTDCPVTVYDPFIGIYAAMTRKHSNGTQYGLNSLEEKITLSQAIKAYTAEGAYINHTEDRLGTLEAGKLADLVVYDRNWFETKPEDILETKALLTVFNGKIVYRK